MRIKSKAIVGALGATAVAGAVVMTGASSAYFFDAEEINGNNIQAGTLDLEYAISGTAVKDGKISLQNVKPGERKELTVRVTNAGTVAGSLTAKVVNQVNDENGMPEPEAKVDTTQEGELGDAMRIYYGNQSVTLNEAEALINQYLKNVELGAGDSHSATFTLMVPEGSQGEHNNIMSDIHSFDVDLSLKQK